MRSLTRVSRQKPWDRRSNVPPRRHSRRQKKMALHVAGLWRYPIKSLAGEPLTEAAFDPHGIPGDRGVLVLGPEGVRTSRRHHRLLGLRGTLGSDGRPLVNGHPWNSADALAL